MAKHGYTALPATAPTRHVHFEDESDDIDSLDDIIMPTKYEMDSLNDSHLYHRSRPSPWIWVIHALLLCSSVTMFIIALIYRQSTLQHVQKYSAWSPAVPAIKYEPVTYNITTKGNKFTGAGSEVDRAWREISYDMGDQWLAESDLNKLGMPATSLKVDHPRTGEPGYRVGMEVFHHLHCLNLLRRITYRDYYEPLGGEFARGEEVLRRHADHCIEVLRTNIQCNADVGLFTFYMIEGDPLAWPQLNSKHVCRDFDKVMTWAKENSVGNMELLE